MSNFRHWQKVFRTFDQLLIDKGVACYYTVVSDVGRYRFAKHFGFRSTGMSINNNLEIMRKDIEPMTCF